ncbi:MULTISPECIES: response regulator [Pseudoalteromonas]|uniref:Chemotaxis protein n=1 Tax=Pseudoalteromonas amylolytica TaxID=1859457 RepID=A0A1S1ML45_9GAMM|nr:MULTISPECIES: response regulator [Pseudoalteromonas]MCF6436810.1 response regulator [Pseudoalteromonas sp. MMG022]OHU85697.1 chemotaxis protein [Pseudoalteromonas sp. JW3]OHU87400.1 chemotaxis protein [Pseudoalteromonas amylolytica]
MAYSILVCDDSTVARKQVIRCLSSALEVNVLQAKDGVEALNILKQHTVDLLCLDLTMPTLDGIGVLEQMRAHASIETFVVVISADIQPEMKQRVMQLGALDFIEKPVDTDRLIALLNRYGIR